ncbi:MAG TPA: hypothetical protein VEM35_07235 [Rhizomicrobium sp.]|nr:hypothetical protein [Rhizomicrobium sp.]
MRGARLFLTAALVALSAPPAGAASYMVGTWFGHGQPESKDSMYIDRMRADGSWRGEYRTCLKGKASDQVQSGRWSLSGDILSLQVEKVDDVPAPRTDSYKILSHAAQSQKYLSLAWNFPYTPQRVADDFQMPSCELTS